MRLLVWLLRAFLFFALFAFALNNLHGTTVHWFFGVQWNAPLVMIVLGAFGLGCAVGVLAMVPAWWKSRRRARESPAGAGAAGAAGPVAPGASSGVGPPDFAAEHPPRDGV